MQKSVFLIYVGLSAYFCTATTDAEIVWLKEVTSQFQTDKRTRPDPDLPDQLFFHLKRKSDDLTLKLTRNHLIDPNVDIYTVSKLEDGRSHLAKTLDLEKEDVAYYQDRENGAFMTARCVRSLSGQCDILINGNIQIQDRYYDIRPLEADVASRNFLAINGPRGRRYVLQEQGSIQREISVTDKDARDVNGKNIEEKLKDLLRRIPYRQDREKQFLHPNVMLSARNVTGVHNERTRGENGYGGTKDKDVPILSQNTIRSPKKEYYVEVLVLLDSGVLDLIREYYSHVMNGVDLLYKGIDDPDIAINVIVRSIYIFQLQSEFPHKKSQVHEVNEEKMINVDDYLVDLVHWDVFTGISFQRAYDEAFLFTKYGLYRNNNDPVAGYAYPGDICNLGRRVGIIRTLDYFLTVFTTAHELGHSLGAVHDGVGDAQSCNPDDLFIMTPYVPEFNLSEDNSRNPWLFSNCSVEAFKKSLKDKVCVHTKGVYTENELTEWTTFMKNLPGEVFNANQQCHIINGANSTYCGKVTVMICRFMYCTDPKTGECQEKNLSAATGTECGSNMVCKEGLCVRKNSK